ncbi:M20 family metallo-hydrolase [Microbacterium oleivorans]|uniref:M20 family metallo-hydrolase n=1 Tax=Microbacterium oleivorans TaxID=273677 RepID=UPI00203C0A0E|nr:M20 family metallo-hydrolase [Microbacterium oleivorans]MCM3696082.1 M20 family metallo-hydrolase [Microbacterium oleivorans]
MTQSGFLDDFRQMSAFGATPGGGVERQAASAADGETRGWFSAWLAGNGFRVETDAIGNIFGLMEVVPGAPYVLVGSHLDSQPLAGRFDGAYGVLAAAHAARTAVGSVSQPRFNVAVVDWFNEEGSRFKPSMMGSAVFTGLLGVADALATTDPAGTTVAQALDDIGGRGAFAGLDVAAYLEIHVEQGRELEETGTTIGVVATTWTAHKLEIVVSGEQSHTGAAPMADRKDALYGAAELIVAVRRLVDEFEPEQLHTAVSEMYLDPNSPVAIAREVRMLVDVRSPATHILDTAIETLKTRIDEIRRLARVDIEIVRVTEWSSGPFLEEGIVLAAEEAERRGHPHRRSATVAGHDATNMKEVVPTILLFVPSVDGISHNEREFTSDDDMLAGLEVLTSVLTRVVAGELEAASSSAVALSSGVELG